MVALLGGALASCTAEPKVTALDQIDLPVYAADGADPMLAESLEDAREMALSSPTYRVHEQRLSPADDAKAQTGQTRMPRQALPEIDGWAKPLESVGEQDEPNQDLQEMSLAAAIAATLEDNGDIAQAAEGVTGADIAAINALFGYLPRVSVAAQYSHVHQEVIDSDNAVFEQGKANFPVINQQAELVMPVIDFERLFTIKVSDTGQSIARAGYLVAAQAAVFETVSAYIAALDAKARLESTETRIRLLDEQLAAEDRLLTAGRSIPAARQLLEIEKGSAAVERTENAENLAVALSDLSRLAGRPILDVQDFDLPPDVWEGAGRGSWQDYAKRALLQNPLMQQRRVEALQRRQIYKKGLSGDFLPNLEAFARQEYEERDASRFGGGSETLDYTFGVRLNVPIFNARGEGFRNREDLSAMRQAIIAEQQVRRELESEIPSLLSRLESQRQMLASAQAAVDAALGLVSSARTGVETGVSPQFAIVLRQLELQRAREWWLRARYAFMRSWTRLAYLTGDQALGQLASTAEGS